MALIRSNRDLADRSRAVAGYAVHPFLTACNQKEDSDSPIAAAHRPRRARLNPSLNCLDGEEAMAPKGPEAVLRACPRAERRPRRCRTRQAYFRRTWIPEDAVGGNSAP